MNIWLVIRKIEIKKNFGWCDDVKSKFYNKPIKINNKIRHEKLYRNDKKYDLLIPIEYNSKQPKKNKGSAIFIHLTRNYKKTQGCVAIKEKDMLILLKLVNKKTKLLSMPTALQRVPNWELQSLTLRGCSE